MWGLGKKRCGYQEGFHRGLGFEISFWGLRIQSSLRFLFFFVFFFTKVVELGLSLSCCRMVLSESCESHMRFLILVKADVDG